MPPSDSSTVNDKTKDKKKDSHDGTNLSQEANDPKNQTGAKGAKPTETDQVPKATVTREGSIFFDVYNKKLQEAGVMPETATVIDKPANVQVDKNGHVTEVTLPNNQKRTFGYDQKGELNSITEPDGRSYKNVDGKWVDAQGKAAPFEKPAVSSNGDLVMTTADQRIVTESQDGKTTALNPKDNSVVTYDGNYHVTNVHYANGQSRSFTYDHDTLTSITETDGKVYTLKDNRWLGPDNANTFNSDAKVLPDGTYTYRQPDGKTISTSTSGQISQINPDGSVCHFDANHRISEIIYTDGKKTQFGYDDQGHPNKLITTDGKTLTLQDGKWRDAQNQDTGISDFRVQADGSFWFKSGNQEFINSTKDTQTSFDSDAIAKAAHDLKEAKDNSTLLIFDSPDTNKIWNILEPMSAAQRQLVAEEYAKQNPGHDLITDLKDKLSGPEVARAEALLKRQDGVADNTGQIHQALAKLADMGPAYDGWVDDDRVRTEKEIRDSINTLTADQLKAVEAKYKQDYGRDLMDDLQSNPNLSDESKQALQIYFKGNDHRSDEDTLKLANLAIEKGRPDIFDEVFRDASQSARDKFTADGGMKKIDDAFDGGDRQIAKDYLTRGCVSIATIVDGDTHWYHTNKDDITRAVTNASDKDRADFKRGEEIKEQNVRPPYSPEDQRALDFYNNVSSKLKDAGNDREADKWKAQLRNNESLITSLLDSHDDGGWFGIGSGTNKNRELSAVENISQQDWTYLKAHPEELSKIETALNHFDDSHKDQVMQMLHDKLSAPDFASSQKVGNRSLLDRLGDNGDNAGNRVDALAGMSPTERQQYLNNTDGFRDKINGQLKSDEEKTLAQRIAGTTGDISPTDRVLIDGIKNADPNQVFRDIEAAFKADPTLKDRINNPQTDEDKKLSQWYHSATHAAVDKAGLGDQFVGEGQTIPGEYATFEDAIFKNGHVPLDQQLRLTDDKQAKVDLILHASDADKARLLQANPDAETKAFQDAVLGTDKDHRAVLTFALMQKDGQGQTGYLSQADQFRLYALDGGNSDNLKTMLAGMTPEQRQNLANEYFTKYHSLITEDVIGKVPGDQQWRFRELLAPTDISVRQIALDAQMNNDAHTSSWDQFLKDNWDYTRVSADSSQDNLNKFIADHAAELDKLSPEQRKQFDDAIANYMQAQKAYIDSKGAFAEAFVDATITVAAIGGACFTGGTSLALLAAIGAGGAVYRTAMMASIQGTDFDSSAGNILKQSFEGGTQAVLGFLGPEQLGLTMGLKVGGELAEQTALHLVEGSTKALFKDGAETILKDELANLTRQGAILGDKEIAAIAEKVAADGVDRNVVEQAIRQQLKSDTMSGLKNIVLNEGESYVKNMLAAQIGSQGKELLATAVGFESPDTLLERMKGTAISTVAGVTMFHGVFRLASSGEYVRVALGRDAAGNVVAGEGTVIRHADGTLEPVVGKETLVKLKPGDTIYEKDALHENPDGSKDLRVGDKTTHYDTNGRVTDVSNSATKTRTSVDYVENPVTKETVLNKALTYNPDGSIDTRASVMLDNGVYYRVNPDGSKGRAVGTDVSVSSDGSITVKGKPSGTNPDGSPITAEIGATRWNNGNPKEAVDSITLHPDGTKEVHYADNATVTTDSFNRVTKLVSADGVTTKFEYSMNDPYNTDVNKLTIGDHTYIKQNGKYVDETGKPAADNIKVFKDGTVDIINPSDTLHTPTKPQEQIESVRIYKDGTTEYRYKALSEAPTDKIDPPKAPTSEKVLEERIKSGDVKAQSDGTYVHEDPASHSRTVYDAKGEVVSVRNSAGQDINFTRDASGDLTKVEYSRNGKVESTYTREEHNGRMFWKETDANGRITGWKNEVRVEPDGSITKLENSADRAVAWSGVKERPDGTKIKIDTVGREKVDASALDTERVRVREFAERGFGGDPERQARFEKWMDDFEAAAAKRTPPLSQEEIANTYYQLDKLISTDNAILSQAERMKLAEQFMYKTSNPQTIGQGYFNTCNVTAEVENRLIQLHPSEALQMVTDVATTGKFITSSGSIIDMSAMNNVLTPFKDVANNAFNPANYAGRDYFDQLFQTTSIETFWQTQATNGARPTSTVWDVRAGNPFRPGDLRYEFSNTPGVSKTGEVINNYSTNPPTRQLAPKSSTMIDPLTGKPQRVVEWVPAESPNLSGDQMLQINKEIVGRNDPPHMLARNSDAAAVNINSSDELAAQLKQMQQNGGFPATVFVDTRDPLISGRPEDGGQGGAHVINVQNVFEKDGKLYVEFTNQWSSANDHLGSKAVPVEDLFRAMEYRPPEQAAVPSKTNNWVKYGVPLAGLTGTAAAAYAAYRILQDSTNKGNKNQPNPMDIYIEPPVQQKQDLEPNTNNSGSGGDGTGFVPQAQPGSQPADKGGR